MNLRFKNIKISNFMSFIDAEVSFEDMGTVLISGENHNPTDNAVSNGSGKSTIFNALCWVLTGETTQGVRSNLENIYGDKEDCWVELEFSVDSDDFVVRRIKTPKSDMKIYVNGIDCSGKGIQESTEVLKQYIPELDSKLLGSIIILGQGLPQRFTNQRPRFRKEFLENITNSDFMINSVRESLQLRLEELDSQLKELDRLRTVNETKVDMYNRQLKDFNNQLAESESYNSEYKLDDRLVYLDNKIINLKNDEVKLRDEIVLISNDISSITNKKSDKIIEYNRNKDKITKELDEEIRSISDKVVSNKTNITSLSKEINRLKSVTDICPTCGQKIPGATKVDTTSYEEELSKLNELSVSLESELSAKLNTKKETVGNLENELSNNMSSYDSLLEEKKKLLQENNESLITLQNRIQKSITEYGKVQGMKDNYNKIVVSISEINKELESIKKILDKCLSDILNTNNHLEVVRNLLKLASGDFRNALLKNVVSYIENKMKEYSMKVFGSNQLLFQLDGNDINMSYCDKPYDNLSGGEKQKYDIIIQLALRELLSKQMGIHSNLLVIDEVFDNLDSIGCQNVIDLIGQIRDIESIFIITHHKETLQITNDSEIIVQKDENGISTLSIV